MKKTLLFSIVALTINAFAQNKQSATQMYNPIFDPMENARGNMDAAEQYGMNPGNSFDNSMQSKMLKQGTSNYLVDSLFRWQWDVNIGWKLVNKSTNRVYDASKNLMCEISEAWNGNSLVQKNQISYTYNANNQLTVQIGQKWNGSTWVKTSQTEYTYDANNNRVNYLSQFGSNGILVNDYHITDTYDANNNQTSENSQNWNGSEWVNQNQKLSVYDVNNNRTNLLEQTWDGSSWKNVNQSICIYNNNNKCTMQTNQVWDGSSWVNTWKYTNSYDSNNNQTASLSQNWDGSAWVNSGNVTYSYYANNNQTASLSQNWDGTTWVNSYQSISSVNENNKLTGSITQKWNGTAWEQYFQSTYTYYDASNFKSSAAKIIFNGIVYGDSTYYYSHEVVPGTNVQSPDWLWAKSIGGTDIVSARKSVVDSAGNVFTTGFFYGTADFDPGIGTFDLTSAGGPDIFISKTDASGNFVWAKRLGGTGTDDGRSIGLDASGNICTTGSFEKTVDFDPGTGIVNLSGGTYIAKFDGSGNFIWAKALEGSGYTWVTSIASDPAGSGNVYITGSYFGTVDFDPGAGTFILASVENLFDIFMLKLDGSGNFVWAKAINGGTGSRGNSIAVDAYGNVYTTGYFSGTADFDPGTEVFNLTTGGTFVSKLDDSGNFVWARQMGGNAQCIAIDRYGNVYTTGAFSGTSDFDPSEGAYNFTSTPGRTDIFISKLNSSGNFVWAKRIGGSGSVASQSIAIGNDGNIYTTGYFAETADFDPGELTFNLTSSGTNDYFISKLNSLGNFIWAKAAGGAGNDFGLSICFDALGNAYATGNFVSGSILFGSLALTNTGITPNTFIAKLGNITTTGIESAKDDDGITIYPNPSSGKFTVSSTGSSISTIEIYDLQGNQVYSDQKTKKQSINEIDLSRVSKGIYLMKIQNGMKITSKKIVIQ